MAKEQRNLDYLIQLAKQGTKVFNIRGKNFSEEESFDMVTIMIILEQNPFIVANFIVPLLRDLVKQYNGDIVNISKTISSTPQMVDEENMKRFALYILGKNFEDTYNKMTVDEQKKYLFNIAQAFDIYNEDRVSDILKYISDLISGETTRKETDPSNTIKMMTISDFNNNEKDYMILLRGLF